MLEGVFMTINRHYILLLLFLRICFETASVSWASVAMKSFFMEYTILLSYWRFIRMSVGTTAVIQPDKKKLRLISDDVSDVIS